MHWYEVNLCALIYHNVKAVSTYNDLVQIKDWVIDDFFQSSHHFMQTSMIAMSEKNIQSWSR